MPVLAGFSDNGFRTRDDMVRGTIALLKPLHNHFSPGKAGIHVPIGTGAHFDDGAAGLEGFARPLWAVGALLAGSTDGHDALRPILQPWIDGFASGTDPNHEEYWGDIVNSDQRMVEAEIISFALLAAPDTLFRPLSAASKQNVTSWLQRLKGKRMPPNNWRWFRIFANLALIKVCGVPKHEVWLDVEADLELLEGLYVGEGWSTDGAWASDERPEDLESPSGRRQDGSGVSRQADYYSGSFAIQFSQLLYSKYAADIDPARAEIYRQRARDFSAGFCTYFDTQGSSVPFGRSLTYRFACGGFFAALAVAQVPDLPEPLSRPGYLRGFLCRHLRWWAKHSRDIFYPDGTLSVGWLYPNLHMAEDYNSTQSPYWCMKTLIAVALPATDAFWAAEEGPYPEPRPPTRTLVPPRHILCNHPGGNHHFLLSTGQFIAWALKGSKAKYSKFAYSSAFAFSVPSGEQLSQLAPDSTLALSRDAAESWAVKWKWVREPTFAMARLSPGEEEVPMSTVAWWPWGDHSVMVETTLIAPTSRWPDWHVRIHRIRRSGSTVTAAATTKGSPSPLRAAEGGFAISGQQNKSGRHLAPLAGQLAEAELGVSEGFVVAASSVLILSRSGASGMVSSHMRTGRAAVTSCTALRPSPNTNIAYPRTLIPLVELDLGRVLQTEEEAILVSCVFAISTEANGGGWHTENRSLEQRWRDVPNVCFVGDDLDGHAAIVVPRPGQ